MAWNSAEHFPSPGSFSIFVTIKCEKYPASTIKLLDDFGRRAKMEWLTLNLLLVKHFYEALQCIARDVWLFFLQRICPLMNSFLTVWNQVHGAKKRFFRTSHIQNRKFLTSHSFELSLIRTEFLNGINLPQFRHLKFSQLNFR